MNVTYELDLKNFEAWSGAVDTLDRIRNEGKCEELEFMLEEMYPDGMTETQLNDLLWFESDTIFEWLGIRTETEIQEELDEANDELNDILEEWATVVEDSDISEDERKQIWEDDYKEQTEELRERIKELEEELKEV